MLFNAKRCGRLFLLIYLLLIFPVVAAPTDATSAHQSDGNLPATNRISHSVLILSALHQGFPISDAVIAGAFGTLRTKGLSAANIFIEYLDLPRNPDPRYIEAKARDLKRNLANRQIGLIIVSEQGALDFLYAAGKEILPPDLPIITVLTQNPTSPSDAKRAILNVFNRPDVEGTLKLGLALFPRTQRLIVVDGPNGQQPAALPQVQSVVASLPAHPEIEDVTVLSYGDMLRHIAKLPPDTLILLGAYFRDGTGKRFVPAEVAEAVAKQANAPVLALYEPYIRMGMMGGSVVLPTVVGQQAGAIAYDLLDGKTRLAPGFTDKTIPPQATFDWLQIRRWGGNTGNLPAGTVFLNRPRSLWHEYRREVIAASSSIAVLTGFVIALIIQNRRRKRAEERLHKYQLDLEAIVEQRTDQLRIAMNKAEAANRAKSAFVANMSHELRTPMNGVLGMAHLIRHGGLTPKQTDQLDKLESSGRHLVEVINAILDLSKIEAGKLALEEEPIELEAIAAEIGAIVAPSVEMKGLQLFIENPAKTARFLGDKTRLKQGLLNYVSNAIKFTDQGQIVLRTVIEDESEHDALIRFEVKDSGVGIDPAVAERLFHAFEQADNSITRKYGGAGLGLVITRNLAELMGGTVGFESALNKGSTFWVTARLRKVEPSSST